jgi:hypothetical protein
MFRKNIDADDAVLYLLQQLIMMNLKILDVLVWKIKHSISFTFESMLTDLWIGIRCFHINIFRSCKFYERSRLLGGSYIKKSLQLRITSLREIQMVVKIYVLGIKEIYNPSSFFHLSLCSYYLENPAYTFNIPLSISQSCLKIG